MVSKRRAEKLKTHTEVKRNEKLEKVIAKKSFFAPENQQKKTKKSKSMRGRIVYRVYFLLKCTGSTFINDVIRITRRMNSVSKSNLC